ncbi:MobA/MobL family protein [Skermanella stibiiresistens]|uniref:MobA/MobL family protein n=1 Tax=Skermanella stibiiresistens TaxID=913326 RepID=UPI003CCC0672
MSQNDTAPAEACQENGTERGVAGRPLEVGNTGSNFQERYDFWERVERNERQGIERGGRIQCRLVIELPHELTGDQRLAILQDFARRFEERGLPHYGVVHKPDENNDSRNYHAHFAYYVLPSRKLANGQWDFEDADTRQNAQVMEERRGEMPRSQWLVRQALSSTPQGLVDGVALTWSRPGRPKNADVTPDPDTPRPRGAAAKPDLSPDRPGPPPRAREWCRVGRHHGETDQHR